MSFDAAPEPVAKGAAIALTGRVWQAARGNLGRVDFYFHAANAPADSYTYQGFAPTSDSGDFARSYPAQTTGTWKAVFPGATGRRNAARLDEVQVVQRRSKEIATWSQATSTWRSQALRIPTRRYKAIVSWTCADNGFPYLYLTWTGQQGGYEYVSAERVTGTLTLKGEAGARRGSFKLTSSTGCTWKVRVFSGIVTVPV